MARILVVDESQQRLASVCEFLRLQGYDVLPCKSGWWAFRRLKWESFDLILAALSPSQSGLWLLKDVQSDGGMRHTPFILWNERPDAKFAEEAVSRGALFLVIGEDGERLLLQHVRLALASRKTSVAA